MVAVLLVTCALLVQNSAAKFSSMKPGPLFGSVNGAPLSTNELPLIVRFLLKPAHAFPVVLMAAPGPDRLTKALLAIVTLFPVLAQIRMACPKSPEFAHDGVACTNWLPAIEVGDGLAIPLVLR